MTKQTLFNKFLLWDKLHPPVASGCNKCKWFSGKPGWGWTNCTRTEKALHNICFKFWNIVEEKWELTIDESIVKIFEAKYHCAAIRICMDFLNPDVKK